MKVRLTNIQRFSLHDGPGIRTTVFLKGCNLNCPWCANPENIPFEKTFYNNKETNEKGYFGIDMNVEEIYKEIIKDKKYYSLNNGGITFSGGEPLLQIKSIEPLLQRLKDENINMCIETALQVPTELARIALKYIDEFIIDIKILNKEECRNILYGNIDLFMKNLDFIASQKEIYTFRIPLTNEYTLKNDNINEILKLLRKYKAKKVEIFKVHNLAESKYKSIGKKMIKFSKITDEKVIEIYKRIKDLGIDVEIIKI